MKMVKKSSLKLLKNLLRQSHKTKLMIRRQKEKKKSSESWKKKLKERKNTLYKLKIFKIT
jgi:hypothetical protein